jgi:hypothetical protein
MPGLGLKNIPNSILGAEDHRVCDESLLIFLEGMMKKGTTSLNHFHEALGLKYKI